MLEATSTLSETAALAAPAPLAAVIPLTRRRRVAGDELTTGQVAGQMKVHQTTVLRIPRERLPYRATEGGHRRYRQVDVDRYLAGQGAPDPAVDGPDLRQAVADLDARLTDLEEWRRQRDAER